MVTTRSIAAHRNVHHYNAVILTFKLRFTCPPSQMYLSYLGRFIGNDLHVN